MTIEQFKTKYKLQFNQTVAGDTAAFFAEAINRETEKTVLSQKVTFSITHMNDGISASQTAHSINELTADDVIDTTKRFATDLLFRLMQVQDYFPLNRDNNIYDLQS